MPHVVVVTPTYNERETLPSLVEKIFALTISGLSVIVVDDNSPDGTGAVADALARRFPVRVIHRREKSGLGTAYRDAFSEIIRTDADYVIQMDADLSHDPAAIPSFLQAATSCDVVLGSRYVSGGTIKRWDLKRRLLSRWGNAYARAVLGLPYRDVTGGYKCFRTAVLKKMDIAGLSSIGYNFQIETTYRAHRAGYRICEIPITFTERAAGASKLNFRIIAESFLKVLALKFL